MFTGVLARGQVPGLLSLTRRRLEDEELALLFRGPCSEDSPDLLLHSGQCFAISHQVTGKQSRTRGFGEG